MGDSLPAAPFCFTEVLHAYIEIHHAALRL